MADQEMPAGAQVIADADLVIVQDVGTLPSYYIDGAQGFSVVNGAAKVNLYNLVQDLSGGPGKGTMKKVFVAQLVMTPSVARSLGLWLVEQATEGDAAARNKNAGPADGKQ